ncbi:MAG: gamma carbonic anhydrase family protein [Bacteroidaceae bacterium]|nr:gamma carbonic anhydrase family protein [Bacteroidaceae bacterium]
MAIIAEYKGMYPKIGTECYFSENAAIIGDVTMGNECSVWFGATVRGDVAPITMGSRVNVQDGAVVHVTNTTGPTFIEDDVSIGHNATVHACTLKKGCLIGMGATVLDHAVVGEGAIVAAGALVLGGTQIGEHEIWGGVPAKFIKKTKPGQAESYAAHYVEYSKEYLKAKEA